MSGKPSKAAIFLLIIMLSTPSAFAYYVKGNYEGPPDDSDGDLIPDGAEIENGLDPNDPKDALYDPDDDGLNNLMEYTIGTFHFKNDTDDDGMPDGWEYFNGLNPTNATDASLDPDGDGVNNLNEYLNGTDPNKPPFTTLINITANASTLVNARSEADTTLEFTTTENLTDISINITTYLNISKMGVNPLTSTYGLAPKQYPIEKSVVVEASDLRGKLNWIVLKVYYTLGDLDMDKDGVFNEPEVDIDPGSLKLYWYSQTDGSWKNLTAGANYTGLGGPFVFQADVDTSASFVWANMSSLSFFGIAGARLPYIPPPPPPAAGVGPAPPRTPPPIFRGGVVVLTPRLLIDVILNQELEGKTFWTAPLSVAASLVLTGEYPTPFSPIVQGILSRPIRTLLEPLKFFRGKKVESPEVVSELYDFSARKALAGYPKAKAVVIAVREPPVDSLAAVAYAKSIDAPILLTEARELPGPTLQALGKMKPERIIIIGGNVAISEAVEEELRKVAPTERIWGPTRYDTAVELAKRLDPEVVVITDGENPMTEATIIAERYKAPVLYVKKTEVPDVVRQYIVKHKKTREGKEVTFITAGLGEGLSTEIQGLYALPEFLTRSKLTIKLYQLGSKAF